MKSEKGQHRRVFFLIAAMILGYASWILPAMFIPGNDRLKWPLSPSLMTDGPRSHFYMNVGLAIIGLVFGLLDPKRGALLGAATGLPIAILSIVEALLGAASHNLLGIEFFVYAIYTLPAILGGLLGGLTRRIIQWYRNKRAIGGN